MASQDLPVPELWRNMRLIGHTDQGGRPDGVQLMVHRGYAYAYAYVGHMFSKGFSVIDVKDPTRPKAVQYVPASPSTWTFTCRRTTTCCSSSMPRTCSRPRNFRTKGPNYKGELGRKVGTADGARARRGTGARAPLSMTSRGATNRARSASCLLMAAESTACGTRVDGGPTRQRSLMDSAITSSSPSI